MRYITAMILSLAGILAEPFTTDPFNPFVFQRDPSLTPVSFTSPFGSATSFQNPHSFFSKRTSFSSTTPVNSGFSFSRVSTSSGI